MLNEITLRQLTDRNDRWTMMEAKAFLEGFAIFQGAMEILKESREAT